MLSRQWNRFIGSIIIQMVGGVLCLFSIYQPDIFLAGMPLYFLAIVIGGLSSFKPAERATWNRVGVAVLSYGGLLSVSAVIQKSELTAVTFFAYWAYIGAVLAVSLYVFMPTMKMRFGLLFSSEALDPPSVEPARALWKWKEITYLGLVMRPIGFYLLLFVISCAIWFSGDFGLPRFHLPGFDFANILPSSLLLPIGFLGGWILTLGRDTVQYIVRTPPNFKFHSKQVYSPLFIIYLWGLLVQLEQGFAQLILWNVCLICLFILTITILRLRTFQGGVESNVSIPLPLPETNRKMLLQGYFFVLISIALYTGLLSLVI